MKIRQSVRHFAAKRALTTPLLGDAVRDRLVALHTRIFLGRADAERADARRDHLNAFFDATMDTYIAALDAGFTEAEAREITHIQANLDFFNHGWTEMMEFPPAEVEAHYDRYRDFFEAHGITVADPLGDFRSAPLPSAPTTPERLDVDEHPYTVGGFADDVYVEDEDGSVRVGGRDPPDDIDVSAAPGLDEDRD